MKTTISLDYRLLHQAVEAARLMGLSRSQFFALAVSDFLQRQRQEEMLRRLNEVYAGGLEPAEKSILRSIKARVPASAVRDGLHTLFDQL